jgi:hypothetical protein
MIRDEDMTRDVAVHGAKVVVRAKPDDAISRVKKMKLYTKVPTGGLTDVQRDLALLALLQKHDLLE